MHSSKKCHSTFLQNRTDWFFIQKAQSTIVNSLPPDPLHAASTFPPFFSTHPNPPQTTNYTSPPSANAPDTKTPAFHKTLGTRVSAPGRRGFLWYMLHTADSTAKYWSDKREDEDCFSLPGTSRYWYRRSSPIHTVPSEILLLNIPGKTPHERCFVQTVYDPPAYKPSADLFSAC